MSQHVIRNGKLYIEYSPVELDDYRAKLAEEIEIKRPKPRPATSIYLATQSTIPAQKPHRSNHA